MPTPTGDCDVLSFELSGQPFMAINAGPEFKFNPSVSFIVNFGRAEEEMKKSEIAALKQAFEARPPAKATGQRRVASRSAR